MSKYSAGDIIDLTYARGDELTTKQVELAPASDNSSRGIIGVFLTRDPIRTLQIFKEPNVRTLGLYFLPPTLILPNIQSASVIPYSEDMSIFYTSTLGSIYIPLANLLFWIWFININVAIFNAIPIYPLDGGQAFKKLLLSVGKVEEKMASRITLVVTLTMVSLVALFISLPYILPLL